MPEPISLLFGSFRDDYLRACRALLREIVRFLRYGPVNFVVLCRGFMQERTDPQFKDLDAHLKVSKN